MLEEKVSAKVFHSKEQLSLVLSLLASMTSYRTLIFNKLKFFVSEKTDKDLDFILDKKLFKENIFWQVTPTLISIDWVNKELFWKKEIRIFLPIIEEWKDITALFKDCFWQIVRMWIIDDMVYHAYLTVINWTRVFINNWKIWFSFLKRVSKIIVKWWNATIDFTELSLEDVLSKEIEQWFINTTELVWDKNRWYWYTHLLRQNAKFYLTKWFRNVLYNWKKINVVYASRSQWKTYDAAYIVCRALLNPTPWFWWRPYREIKYFIDNKDTIWENFFRYVKSLLWELVDLRIDWKKVFKVNESSYTIECSITWNRLEVVSLYKLTRWTSNELWDSTWEWIACDDAIIDEAARIPDKFWYSFFQRAAFETSSFFIITTANEETPVDHWSYELLIKWELWDEDISSYRITIDDNEILKMSVPPEKVDSIIEWIKEDVKKKWWMEWYYARLYCIIFDKKKIFQIASNLIKRRQLDEKDFRVIILDPAKLSDNAWIVVINVKEWIIEQAEKLINADYDYQLKRIKELKGMYNNSVTVADRWWAWEFLAESDKDWVIEVRIKSTWQWDLKNNWKYFTIAKWLMIWFLDTLFRKRVLNIFDDLYDLISQLWKFIEIKSKHSNIILYKWEWKEKDDLVLSLANWSCYIYKVLWLHTKEEWVNYSNQFDNYMIYSYNNEENNNDSYYNPVY